MAAEIFSLIAPLFKLLVIDLILGLLAFLLISLLARRKRAAYAVLKRNFLGYFANPTGYVFLCLFVLLTSMAAFWPHEFFNSNLANLDQLNFWFPIIMLFFIPAITMSIWADERRQGTDELLLTLPADDFDIVIGKYMSAAAIYTVSLVFSQISTFIVLMFLSNGYVDTGLFFANYLGYWFIGLAMLSIGMIASFLTHNLTVGFILGALFNAPLAFASMSDVIIPWRGFAQAVSTFSIREQFDNFGRGVISVAPIAFFTLLVAFGLYLCMVLIGRRHWSGGKDSNVMFLHYLGRVILLVVIVFSLSYFLKNNDRLRLDATEGQVSSLSPKTKQVIRQLKPERPIVIEAYISRDIPEQYARTRYDLVTQLKEFQALASGRNVNLQVQIFDNLEISGEVALRAEKQYGIEPQAVRVRERGAFRDHEVLLGAAIRSGLSKVIVPFFESGIPVEYELVRSINTVAQPRRAKLGVVSTDANFMGGVTMGGGGVQQLPKQPIVEELEKQYEVEEVDLTSPISPDQYNVLLVVQPSSLGPDQLSNLVSAIEAGVPTAIFEDPFPFAFGGVPGTGEPKRPQGGMMGMQQQPQPKGEIQQLWDVLGLDIPVQAGFEGVNPDIVWQQYNPHPKLQYIANATDQWLFITDGRTEPGDYLSEDSKITAGLRELMFLYAGAVKGDEDRDDLTFTELVKTREVSGLIGFDDVQTQLRSGTASPAQLQLLQGPPTGEQILAVTIESVSRDDASPGDVAEADSSEPEDATVDEQHGDDRAESSDATNQDREAEESLARGIKAVYVADIDCMHPIFSETRKRPEQYEELDLNPQNITFILNVIDVLAGEEDYPTIRAHEPQHVALRLFEDRAEQYRLREIENQKEYQEDFNQAIREAEEENQKVLAKFEEKVQRLQREGATDRSKQAELISSMQQLQMQQKALERKLAIRREKLESERDARIQQSRREAENQIRKLQNFYKFMAIALPPIPPLIVGISVFVTRRVREREGISKSRLR